MTKRVPLSQQGKNRGKYFAVVDDRDFERVNERRWFAGATRDGKPRYALCSDGTNLNMSNFILGIPSGTLIDHIDRNGLNNTRNNLRPCTGSQNAGNRGTSNPLGLKGIHKHGKRYVAIIRGKHIGSFDTPEAAARAYDAKAVELFGEFARLNFPQELKA